MYEITMDELQQMLRDRCIAIKYAWDHREEITSREHAFTLYGPYVPGIGASIPCNTVTSKRARKLVHKTRRKDYIIYHLDESYQVLRTILVLDRKTSHIHHHFELDGAVYVYTYESPALNQRIEFFRYKDGKPVSYGEILSNFVFVQFYEYVDAEKMLVTTYRYSPKAKHSIYGHPIDPDAPIGADNSSVHQRFYEETPENTDFSRWFK